MSILYYLTISVLKGTLIKLFSTYNFQNFKLLILSNRVLQTVQPKISKRCTKRYWSMMVICYFYYEMRLVDDDDLLLLNCRDTVW